jgi:hypothetical protein
MKAKEFIPTSKPRNFVAKNAQSSGAGRHQDSSKKKDMEQGKVKHKKDLVPMEDQGVAESANVDPQFINVQVTKILAGEARRMTNAPIAQLLDPVMKEYGLTLQQINSMVPGGLKKAAAEYGIMMKEGWSDAMVSRRTGTPRTPYSVYIKGKKWKDFSNDDHARAVMDKLKAKFKADGRDPETITIAPTEIITGEASALEKFRKAADEREKKHTDAEKEMKARHASGKEDMKGAIDRLEKHLNNKDVGEGSVPFAGAKVGHKEGPEGQWRNKGPKANKPAKAGDLVGSGS